MSQLPVFFEGGLNVQSVFWPCYAVQHYIDTKILTDQQFTAINIPVIDRHYRDLYVHILRQSGYFNTFPGGWYLPIEILTIYFVCCSEIIHVICGSRTIRHIVQFSTCFIRVSF